MTDGEEDEIIDIRAVVAENRNNDMAAWLGVKRVPHHYDKYGHQWAASYDGTQVECVQCAATRSSSDAKIACLALWAPED